MPRSGVKEDHIVFAMEKKGCMHKAQMAHLKGGDIYCNKWPVPSIPFSQCMRVPKATADEMFIQREVRAVLDDEGEEGELPFATDCEIQLENNNR